MVLNDVNIKVGAGEIVCVAGPNGAGKSTLLKAIVGLVPWSRGSMATYGVPMHSGEPQEGARNDIAIVSQLRNVFPSLTVQENLVIAAPRSWSTRQRSSAIAQIYEDFKSVADARKQMGGCLSGGQRQLVAFAMAVIKSPRLLLLDEPTAALAPNMVRGIFERIVSLRNSGIPILLIEQNVRAAMDVADRAYFLENGRNALEGSAADLRNDPRIRKVYLGEL